jgi:hypothetical protein
MSEEAAGQDDEPALEIVAVGMEVKVVAVLAVTGDDAREIEPAPDGQAPHRPLRGR